MELQLEPLGIFHTGGAQLASWLLLIWWLVGSGRQQADWRWMRRDAQHGKNRARSQRLLQSRLAASVSLYLLGCSSMKQSEWVCDCASGAMQTAARRETGATWTAAAL